VDGFAQDFGYGVASWT